MDEKTFNYKGLSAQKAAELIEQEGYNEMPGTKKRGLLAIAFGVFKEPMFLLLVTCGIIYLIAGEPQEALLLLSFVFVVMGITFYQERKTERALEALRDLSSPRALVIRDGEKLRIPGREVVKGDILLLSEGDRVPADALLLEATSLTVDESLLTGESVPVRKLSGQTGEINRPGGDDLPFVYSGTLVVGGQGIAEVTSTGMNTEIGKIGKALQVLPSEYTPLQQQTRKLVRLFALLGVGLCTAVVIIFGLTRHDWLQGFLAGLSLAMAMLPEEFPVVLTLFLALGAWRISKKRVLTRRVPAVETLGSASVLCVDKTGTLTMNKMTVADLCVDGEFLNINQDVKEFPEKFHKLIEYSILASPADPFDLMEKAMHSLAKRALAQTEHLHDDWDLLREYPLSKKLLAMSRVWESNKDRQHYIIAAKGAPEAIADICHFDAGQKQNMLQQINALSDKGRRVIAVAEAKFTHQELPKHQHKFDFRFVGLLGLEDPVRPGVKEAVEVCYQAGIRTIMITGDYPGTAVNIARQIRLKDPNLTITGAELESMSDAELSRRIKITNVFARVVPEQKLRLVKALQSNGEVVAMTGDGVNDAPALKSAHIGVAMGARGTDVAREAASIVLLDDDFSSIEKAVAMGRRIYDNLKKAMMYIFSVHIPIAGMSILPIIFKWPLALFPIQIVFLELIIDPACSIVFEAEKAEKNIMQRPPRRLGESLFNRHALFVSGTQGLVVLAGSALMYWWMLGSHNESVARAACFTILVLGNIGLILSSRSHSQNIIRALKNPNKALWWIVSGAIILLVGVTTINPVQRFFKFADMTIADLLICIAAALVVIVLMELIKLRPKTKKLTV
jgi:Ca2+-transporting ATPase